MKTMAKIDQVLEKVTNTQIDIMGIKEHLKTLNGKVDRNVREIENNRKRLYGNTEGINQINKNVSYYKGAMKIVGIIFGILSAIIIGFIIKNLYWLTLIK